VRYQAARGLLTGRDKRAVPVLIALLEDGVDFSSGAEELLLVVAGVEGPITGWGPEPDRRKEARRAWQDWWEANNHKIDLTKVNFGEAPLGWTLVCAFRHPGKGPGDVLALGRDGKERWGFTDVESPIDLRLLPGGRILVAEDWGNRLTERDRKGKVLREFPLPGMPVCCQRLANGNTFTATHDALVELTPDGKILYTMPNKGNSVYYAEKLPDGRIVSLNMGGVVTEYDSSRKEIRSFTPGAKAGGLSWGSVERLPGDRYLIALSGPDKVMETDGTGKVLWEVTVKGAAGATRLKNGHTLVNSLSGFVVEVDKGGKEVWKATMPHRPFRARRY
jgi:hypothetical protein